MTASTQGLTGQSLAGSGTGFQPGSGSPGFPPPISAEQYFGIPQQYGFQTPYWPQVPYGMPQVPYGMQPWNQAQTQFGNQAPSGLQQPSAGQRSPQQELIQQLVGQILPIAQQMILPQVIALAVQQVQQQVQQIAAQAVPQLAGQQPFASQQGQSQQGQQPFWGPHAAVGQFGPITGPYAVLS